MIREIELINNDDELKTIEHTIDVYDYKLTGEETTSDIIELFNKLITNRIIIVDGITYVNSNLWYFFSNVREKCNELNYTEIIKCFKNELIEDIESHIKTWELFSAYTKDETLVEKYKKILETINSL
jgi:hypothetical protein